MKKNILGVVVITIILSLCLSSVVFAGGESIKVGIVTDVGGRGDRTFNDSAIRALETWAAKVKYVQGGGYEPLSDADFTASIPKDLVSAGIYSLNVVPIVLESKDKKDYIPNISTLVEQAGCDLVIGVGFMLAGSIGEAAIKYPDIKFILIDALPVDETGTVVELSNVISYLFNEHECGFLVGAIAGYATKTGKVGYIGGMIIPPVTRYEAGYRAGIKTTNPNAAIYGQYTGSFTEPSLGKISAESQISQGCDILFQVAGATGNGMFQAICEKGAPYWAIGVDVDQGIDLNLCPDRTLTSAIKHLDYATYIGIKSVVEDTFKSGFKVMALKDGGVAYAPDRVKAALTQEEINKVEHLSQMIIDGEITVPQDPKDVKAWNPPTDF